MKKSLIVILIFLCCFLPVSSLALIGDVRIITEEVTPEPVEPGQDVTVKISIYNQGEEIARNVEVKLEAGYPFYLKGESKSLEEIGDLPAGFSKDNTYYLVVDPKAVSGIYTIKFTATIDKRKKVEKEVSIKVTGLPDIVFESEDKHIIKPGDTFLAKVTLLNIGTGKARNIKVIPLSEKFVRLGSGINVVKELRPGQSANLLLEFGVGKKINPDTYNIPIQITFLDEGGLLHTFTENLGVRLVGYGDVGLQNWKIIPPMANVGEEFILQIRLENVGTGEAKKVRAVLHNTMAGNKEVFVGRLEKNEEAPGIFTLIPHLPGNNYNRLVITYEDDLGEHEKVEEFFINVGIASKLASLVIAILISGVLMGLYFFFLKKGYIQTLKKRKGK